MKIFKFSKISIAILAIVFVFGFAGLNVANAALAPGFLGLTDTYSVFGDAGIIGGAAAAVWGDAGQNGTSDGSLSGQQAGTYYTAAQPLVVSDISSAYGDLAGETQTGTINLAVPNTIVPGVYDVGTTATFTAAQTLVGAGTYIFRGADSIAQTAGGTMTLTGGACASNVYWRTGTQMTFAATGNIEGTIIAGSAITFANSALTFKGRALAGTNVDLGGITITEPVICAVPPTGGLGHYVQVVPPPLINILKIPSPLALPSGPGPVTYNYTVTNIGAVAMNDVWVKDDKCSPIQFISGDINNDSLLDIDEVWKYSCTKTVSETETNIATAHGAAVSGEVWDTSSATIVVGKAVIPPLIYLVKIPNKFLLPVGGGAVTYNYTVTNPGTEPLSNVFITDNKCTGLPGRVVGHPGDLNKNNLLESNETWAFTCQSNITQTTTNIGTAEGHANGLTAIDFSPATVVVAPVVPKLPKTGFGPDGENIPWNVIVPVGILGVLVSFYLARKKQIN